MEIDDTEQEYVVLHVSQPMESSETSDLMDTAELSEYVTLAPVIMGSSNPSTSQSQEDGNPTNPLRASLNEPTLQYLLGQITFEEFSDMMELREEPESDVIEITPIIDGVTEVVTTETVHEDSVKKDTDVTETGNVDLVENSQKSKKKSLPRKAKRRVFDLPKHLQGLMGEANIRFAKGEHQEAIDICLEIIRMAPQAVLPFQTLAMLYEEQGDTQKSLQFNLIAAYLNPSDTEQWQKLAEMSLEQKDIQQAIRCYSQAIKSDNKNHNLYYERSKLYEEVGDQKKALDGYKVMLKYMPKEEGEKCMEIARNTCKLYFDQDNKPQAMETMQNAFKSNPEWVTAEDVNLLLELQMEQKEYLLSVEILVKYCGVTFTLDDGDLWNDTYPIDVTCLQSGVRDIIECTVSELLPIDLRVKLAVCLISLKKEEMAELVTEPLYEEDIEEVGDLYLDIAEMYMEMDKALKARPLLQRLVCSSNYSLAAVWLRYADCLHKVGDMNNAVEAYNQVIELAPSHVGARMSLSSIQQKLGKHDEAIQALDKDEESEAVWTKQEINLYFQKCLLLHSQGKTDEFIVTCKQLLFNHYRDINDPKFIKSVMCFRSMKNRHEMLMPYLKNGFSRQNVLKIDVPVDDLWDLFVKMCELIMEKEDYEELLIVTAMGMSNHYFKDDPRKSKQTEFMCLLACIKSCKEHFAFSFVREACLKPENSDNMQLWNLLNQILLLATESRHSKFCLRYLLYKPEHIPVSLLNGHNASISGTYMYALSEYVSVFRERPDIPMVHLCIGLTFIQLAGQKFSARKHHLLAQGLAFLNSYLQLRGECQEVFYNVGRALHQLGLTYAAVHYYKKTLELPPMAEEKNGRFDLARDAAYNLKLIYESSGSRELAVEIVQKYLVI